MSLAWLLALLVLGPATWIAALAHAVKGVSRSAIEQRLAGTDREPLGAWFLEHAERATISLSAVRSVLSAAFVAAIVVAFTAHPTVADLDPAPGDGIAAAVGDGAASDGTPDAAPAVPSPVDAGDAGHEAATPAAAAPAEVRPPSVVTPRGFALAILVASALLWVCTVVIASAVARAAGEQLVAASLRSIRLITMAGVPLQPVERVFRESVRRLAGADRQEAEQEAEAELLRSIEEQQRGGGLDPRAASMLENIVWFNQTDVGEVMTPRTDIDGIEYTDDIAEIRSLIDEHGHSRMPVFEENLDHILGILYVKDLVPYLGADASGFELRPLLREPKFVPESKQVNELLQDFQRSEVHMAIVVDEYGGTAGVVTIEDVLEEIVGEIQDEHDTDHEDLPTLDRVEDGLVEVDGRYHLDDLNEALGLDLPEDEEYDTVAGFLLARLGRVPDTGEAVTVEGAVFEVLVATSTAIERIRVSHGARARADGDSAEAEPDDVALTEGVAGDVEATPAPGVRPPAPPTTPDVSSREGAPSNA